MTQFKGSKADVLSSDYVLPIDISLINIPQYADAAARDNDIPAADRRAGLIIYRADIEKLEFLKNDLTTWETVTSA